MRRSKFKFGFCFAVLAGVLAAEADAAIMTVGIQNVAGAGATASPQTAQTLSYTVSAGASRILVVYVGTQDNSQADSTVSSVTYNSVALTQAPSTVIGVGSTSGQGRSGIWYLLNPGVGTANLVVNYPGNVSNRTVNAGVLTNVKQQAPTASTSGTPGNVTAASVSTSITTTAAGSAIFDGVLSHGSTLDFSATSPIAKQNEVDLGSGNTSNSITTAIGFRTVASASTVTNTWTTSATATRLSHSLAAFAPIVSTLTASPTTGSTISLTGIQPVTTATSTDAVSLTNSGDAGSTISVSSFAITGTNAALFSIPDFTTATLTAGGTSNILYDVGFLGAPTPGVYTAAVKFTTSDGDVSYNLSATVIPEPTTGIVFGLFGLAGLSARRRRSSSR